MPRKKSPKQDFIPLTEAKQTVEIEVKPRPTTQEIEKVESSPKKRKRKKIQKRRKLKRNRIS